MKADYLKANVAIGGDIRNVLHVTNLLWPEVCVMRELHGEQAVNDIVVTHTSEIDPRSEFERIRFSYPEIVVRNLYPGVNPNLKWEAPDYIDSEVAKAAPAKPAKPDTNKTPDLL
jgi:hypothetical protein